MRKVLSRDVVYATNCDSCSKECLSLELIPIRLGDICLENIKVCLACLVEEPDVQEQYEKAIASVEKAINSQK